MDDRLRDIDGIEQCADEPYIAHAEGAPILQLLKDLFGRPAGPELGQRPPIRFEAGGLAQPPQDRSARAIVVRKILTTYRMLV